MLKNDLFLKALNGESVERPPVWMMRQAGRTLWEEAHGIGSLFSDNLKEIQEISAEQWYSFVTETGNEFLESYIPIVERRKNYPYTESHRKWQEIRRGRYVEFNLVHDRGTLFGFKTKGWVESILVSLPPHVQWIYDDHPAPGTEEEKILKVLQKPRAWAED